MKFFFKKSFRPSDLVLVGDQFLIFLGLSSALLAYYRILQISDFPIEKTLYYSILHVTFGIIAWVICGVYKKVIRFFNSTDYLNLIAIVFLVHVLSAFGGYFLPAKFRLE